MKITNKLYKSLVILTLLFSSGICFCQIKTSTELNDYSIINPEYEFIPVNYTKLTDGILFDRYLKNFENLYLKIDAKKLAQAFHETHSQGYAEPEFVGHYLDAGTFLYNATGENEIFERNKDIVTSIINGQRKDGYLGTYHEGLEFSSFSVWNQNFIIKGLIAYYNLTNDEKALNAAVKCADYVSDSFLNSDTLDLLDAGNQGIQHATILEEITHLYRITGKELYLKFANFIIEELESSSIKPIYIPSNFDYHEIATSMGCTKGIEMFVTFFGILEMYRITGNEKYLNACVNYWESLKLTQIGITGNGTLREHWNYIGNSPVEIESNARSSWHELNPNENCVAVGWMKFCAELGQYYGETKYFDEFEKTLYNHLLGSQAVDGHDFSYYQGNIGFKIHETNPNAYSCCRYRGMRMMSYLPQYIYMQSKNEIVVNIYTSSTTEILINNVKVKICQTTEYPKNGKINLLIDPDNNISFRLLLRKPEWCKNAKIFKDGKRLKYEIKNGYMVLDNQWKETGENVSVELEMEPFFVHATIANTERVAIKYGPLVLAIDNRFQTPINGTKIKCSKRPVLNALSTENEFIPIVKFSIDGEINGKCDKVTLVDYASAGSLNPNIDKFRIWIPTLK